MKLFLLIFFMLSCSLLSHPLEAQTEKEINVYKNSLRNMVPIDDFNFNEKYRPQFHFSPPAHWTNDPNGLVYYNGEYHLFYQHFPDSIIWGPMHWGHAVSKDLIHWQHLPVALYPDSLGWIFSGSAVIDNRNTSGFGTKENPPMVAIFTYHSDPLQKKGRNDFQTQGIAYSLDKGRTWTKYEGNPVLRNPGHVNFRDPKVSWHGPSERWIMVLAVGDHVEIYSSADLKSWNFESSFGKNTGAHNGTWECPDLFPLKDAEGNELWVMLVSIIPGGPNGGSATQYFVGDFDGSVYTPRDSLKRWLDFGCDNYAGVTYNDIPEADGRRIFIGWMTGLILPIPCIIFIFNLKILKMALYWNYPMRMMKTYHFNIMRANWCLPNWYSHQNRTGILQSLTVKNRLTPLQYIILSTSGTVEWIHELLMNNISGNFRLAHLILFGYL